MICWAHVLEQHTSWWRRSAHFFSHFLTTTQLFTVSNRVLNCLSLTSTQVYGASPEQLKHTPVLRRLAARGRVDGVDAPISGHADHCSALVRLTPGNAGM